MVGLDGRWTQALFNLNPSSWLSNGEGLLLQWLPWWCADRPGCWLWHLFGWSWCCVSVWLLLIVGKDRIHFSPWKQYCGPGYGHSLSLIHFPPVMRIWVCSLKGSFCYPPLHPYLSLLLPSFPCKDFNIKDGAFLQNIRIHLQDYIVLQSRKP
jgi:hypothetical protein